MTRYLIQRILGLMFVVLAATTFIFFLLRLTGDPVLMMLGDEASPAEIEKMRIAMKLHKPILVQYLYFLRDAAIGDFGTSYKFSAPALQLVLQRLPATIELISATMFIIVVIAIPAGVVSGVRRGRVYDNMIMTMTFLGQCAPVFWLGLMLIIIFSIVLGWLPPSGRGSFLNLILPAFTLATYQSARIARTARSSVLDQFYEDYVRTARSKGLSEVVVIFRHVLRNSILTILTVSGYTFAYLIGGVVVVETVFAWPGMGRFLVDAVHARDYPLVQSAVFIIAVMVAVINILIDISYAIIDPKIKYR